MALPADRYSLVADVGGTNTRVALAEGRQLIPETVRRYRNIEYASLTEVLTRFLDEEGGVDCAGASVAIAGPVRDGRGTLTNLDWRIDRETLAAATKAEVVAVLNDLEAQGHSLGLIPAENLSPILPGRVAGPEPVQLVIGLGTGVNAAPVHDGPEGRVVSPAEAGHVALPMSAPEDADLHAYLVGRDIFPSVEEVLSGRGIIHLHDWIADRDGHPPVETSRDLVEALDDEGAVPGASAAARAYVRILGTAAGDLALTFLPFGGIYFAGGMARAFAPHLGRLGFAEAFRNKGRFSSFMDAFPVTVIEDDYAALAGSAAHLSQLSRQP